MNWVLPRAQLSINVCSINHSWIKADLIFHVVLNRLLNFEVKKFKTFAQFYGERKSWSYGLKCRSGHGVLAPSRIPCEDCYLILHLGLLISKRKVMLVSFGKIQKNMLTVLGGVLHCICSNFFQNRRPPETGLLVGDCGFCAAISKRKTFTYESCFA